jgi:hypothetical protein
MVGTPTSMADHRVTTSQLSRQAGGGDRHGDATLGLDQIVPNGPVGTLTGRVLSFTKGTDAVTTNDVTYAIEESDDLGQWTLVSSYTENDSTAIS